MYRTLILLAALTLSMGCNDDTKGPIRIGPPDGVRFDAFPNDDAVTRA